MKRSELLVSVALVPLDFLALILAAWSAFNLRRLDIVTDIRPILFDFPVSTYLQSAAIVAILWIIIFALVGLYRRRTTDGVLAEFGLIFFACALGLVCITMLVFLRGELFSSRFIILAACALAVIYVTILRVGVRRLQRLFFRLGYGAHRVAIVGQGHMTDSLLENITANPELGYAVAVHVSPDTSGLMVLRDVAESLDEILVVDSGSNVEIRQQFLEFAEEHHIVFRYAPDVLVSPIGAPVIDFDFGVPIIEVPETTLVGWKRVQKRVLDIAGGFIALILLSLLILLVAFLVWLESGFPVIYKSQRISRNRRFTFLKFRTMQLAYCTGDGYGGSAAEQFEQQLIRERNVRQGPVPKIANDPRWTRVGKWLRRFSLDELPQLWNVVRGDMSLVGPRPHLPKEVANYERHHKKVLAIKPGMTGLAQVSGRSDLDFDDEVRLDRYYIEHWSLWLDFRILLKTVYVIFERRATL